MLVRSDLSPGQQLAQTAHAVGEFAFRFRDAHVRWASGCNYLVVLAADEATLLEHADAAPVAVLVREPDLGDIPTAAALIGDYWPHLSSLPLAGREVAMSG